MYILYCDIFWLKLIDKNFFNQIFNATVVSQFVSDLQQVCGFLRELRFLPPIKLTSTL
jgi:hypothetical protein